MQHAKTDTPNPQTLCLVSVRLQKGLQVARGQRCRQIPEKYRAFIACDNLRDAKTAQDSFRQSRVPSYQVLIMLWPEIAGD